jgi:hypothetical protein
LAYIAPGATPVANAIMLHPQGWSPRPTEPPKFIELLKRQSSGSLTLIEGPDPVCGYQFGSFSKQSIPSLHVLPLIILLRWRIGTVRNIKMWIRYSTGPGRGDRLLWSYRI